jgi:hypothetical protein
MPIAAAAAAVNRRAAETKREEGMVNPLALALVFAAALVDAALAEGASRFDGQYVGKLTLDKVISGDCTRPPPGALYPLTVAGGRVEFNYVPRFDTILRGYVGEDGTFRASYRLRDGIVSMTGRIAANTVTATILSPSCRYTFETGN